MLTFLGALEYTTAACFFPDYLENNAKQDKSFWHYRTRPLHEEDTHVWFNGRTSTSISYRWDKKQSHTERTCEKHFMDTNSYLIKQKKYNNGYVLTIYFFTKYSVTSWNGKDQILNDFMNYMLEK
jgi:hypothetical protein